MGCRAVTWSDLERYHYPSDRSIQVVKQKEGASLGQVDPERAGRVSREALERAYKPATRREIRFVKLWSGMRHVGVGTDTLNALSPDHRSPSPLLSGVFRLHDILCSLEKRHESDCAVERCPRAWYLRH